MPNKLVYDDKKGKKIAELLYRAFSTTGVHGRTEMPEDLKPKGMRAGSLEHLLFITLTVSIDYQRDAPKLWESARKTFEDSQTNYLFDPRSLHITPFAKVVRDMQEHRLSKKPKKDANIWRTVGVTFYKKWGSDPRNFLEDCGWNARTVLERLKTDSHESNSRQVSDYPYLRGNKISPLWLRMLRDNVGLKLQNLDKVPIPVDVHVARASLAIGVVKGKFRGRLQNLFNRIRSVWAESVTGLTAKDREMVPIDVDEPLWHLSKYGCTKRNKLTGNCPLKGECEAKDYCINGKIIIDNYKVEMDT